MKNWFLPIAVLGFTGLALLWATPAGQEKLQELMDTLGGESDPLGDFNRFLDEQLTSIQRTLDHLSKALEEGQA
jgi:hypothetical protein